MYGLGGGGIFGAIVIAYHFIYELKQAFMDSLDPDQVFNIGPSL